MNVGEGRGWVYLREALGGTAFGHCVGWFALFCCLSFDRLLHRKSKITALTADVNLKFKDGARVSPTKARATLHSPLRLSTQDPCNANIALGHQQRGCVQANLPHHCHKRKCEELFEE